MTTEIIHKEESFEIIGKCMEVHAALGGGLAEILYKDALEIAFAQDQIFHEREKKYTVAFRGITLPHPFYADFIVMDKILLEAKSVSALTNEHTAQVINYLKLSGLKLGLLVNFGKISLEHKRIVV